MRCALVRNVLVWLESARNPTNQRALFSLRFAWLQSVVRALVCVYLSACGRTHRPEAVCMDTEMNRVPPANGMFTDNDDVAVRSASESSDEDAMFVQRSGAVLHPAPSPTCTLTLWGACRRHPLCRVGDQVPAHPRPHFILSQGLHGHLLPACAKTRLRLSYDCGPVNCMVLL